MKESKIPEDILLEIFRLLPKKSLARFKCVSKRWLLLISNLDSFFYKTTQGGIVFQSFLPRKCRRESSARTLGRSSWTKSFHLHLKGTASPTASHRIARHIPSNFLLLSSCNGFLLYRNELARKRLDYVVFQPATERSWYVSSPKFPGWNRMHLGLVSHGRHFKLLLLSALANKDRTAVCCKSKVFSSEYGEWDFVKCWNSSAASIPLIRTKTIDSGKSVFVKGAFHWIWENSLLIHHLGKEDCTLVELPRLPNHGPCRDRKNQCIWDSEGCVNYCFVSAKGHKICMWTLHRRKRKNGKRSFKWKVKHEGILHPPPMGTEKVKHRGSFSPFAFNDDFETVYLMWGRRVFSYKLASREVKEACTSPFQSSHDRAFCIASPFLHPTQVDIAATENGDTKRIKRRKLD